MASHVLYIGGSNGIGDNTNTKPVTHTSKSFALPAVTTDNLLNNSITPRDMNSDIIDSSTVRNSSDSYSTDKDISGVSLDVIITRLNETLNIPNIGDTAEKEAEKSAKYYNRFKFANPNLMLQKGFAHVYFVRPNCNILQNDGRTILPELEKNELFEYAYKSAPWLLQELTSLNGSTHDFMMSLSNAVTNFPTSDEYISTNTYGNTYTGYKIAYGKNNIESKTAGSLSFSFNDDRKLHTYQLHRLWVEYINGVYRGEIAPRTTDIYQKILDYAGACYYIITAEDDETIIFWSKYYGIFPTSVPSSQYAWGAGNFINSTSLDISYQYSFKEDYNPYTIMEFNYNSRVNINYTNYDPIYDEKLGHVGNTWVNAPFIELQIDNTADCPYVYKLRHRQKD